MRPYCLAPHVHVCASEEGAVFLDLEKDAYVGLEIEQARALSSLVEDWPEPQDESIAPECDAHTFAQMLCERGLLAPAATPIEYARPPRLARAESELIPWDRMTWRHVRVGHVLRFLLSALTAALLLRCRRFPSVVDRLRRRKARHAKNAASLDSEVARKLLSAYCHIRPFVFGQKGRCLLDSLTLLEFLAHYELYPTWVIGVQIIPFGSHSWVQHESFVLNGTPAYVRAYTPILVL